LTYWYENGQKESEWTYKDGILFFNKCWDEDGNEMDCPG
jgi:antitoxin component YwqK of YwqJK toxin-antitoxin module